MAYTQYSLQLHIHINTKSTYISYVNVILFKHRRKEKQCNIMLNFHSTWSLVDSQTAFPVVGWTFIFQFHYYLSSEGTWAWVEDSRWRTTQVRVRDRRSARESSWKHWDGLRCLGNSIYSTLLETQQILLRHLCIHIWGPRSRPSLERRQTDPAAHQRRFGHRWVLSPPWLVFLHVLRLLCSLS